MKKTVFLSSLCMSGATALAQQEKPNIIVVYIDDMGYSDPSCYGGTYTSTPNIDKLADEGIRFTQYYSACPISSPSRVGITTGMYPTRWGITTYLQDRAGNAKNEQNDYLDDRAPSMARSLKANGYATGHFGKWHMGGGRDVNNAPSITNYGFDEYASTWESPDPDPKLTATNWIWDAKDEVKRWNRTAYFVDKTLDFLSRHPDQPCFINFWPDDVHTPWVYENDETSKRESAASFTIVLAELDVQIGRLMKGLKDLGIDDNTLVIFTSDNGPAPAFSGSRTQSLRGQKATLYEGGIRMPFIVRWPKSITPGQVNSNSVVCSVDLLPSLCAITGATVPAEFPIDGEDLSDVLFENKQTIRTKPIFWEFGKTKDDRVSPHIAVRDGDWKLLVNSDGSSVELYNMKTDYLEKTNVASSNPDVVNRLKPMAINWFKASFREFADNVIRVAIDGEADKDGSSWDKATTLNNAVSLSAMTPGSKIWLKTGTYVVTSSINFDGLTIYGGFEGTEHQLDERNWLLNPSVLDGGNAVSPLRNNTLAASGGGMLDGVIVQNSVNQPNANGSGNGGGMILSGGSVIRNCIFRNNRTQDAKNGAALHCHLGNITIENSLFANNTSSGNGGAVQVGGNAAATIINCTFVNNKSAKPGGAFGLGTATSNLTLINTIAYDNLYGETIYNSYGQNDNINAGGTVISKYSAIESTSTKFTDGDDVAHITLTREISPGFMAPVAVTGYTNIESEIEQIKAASYQLVEGSLCIDAGDASLARNLELDLGLQRRISGNQIDIGAYEYDNGLPADNRIIRVATNGDAGKDGSSWENATTLDKAVALSNAFLANEPQVWLKAGTYTVTSSINFDGLAIYGGFAGTEQQSDERNWQLNPSILDGGNTVSPLRNNTLEARVNSVLDGVIIQNGVNHPSANGSGNGGGMILANGAVVRNCIFRNNRTQNAKNGAALHCHLGNITIENSLFVNNTSSGNGGAVQVGGGASTTIINCTFANNKSTKPGGAFGLGNNSSNLTLLNTVAYNNLCGETTYNSFGQNDDMNAGGTVISKNSAIESASTKFTDGDDIAHIRLSRTVSPCFSQPCDLIGHSANETEIAAIEAASYQLSEGSPCIDAGDLNFVSNLPLDLSGQPRIVETNIDMGAYEYVGTKTNASFNSTENMEVFFDNGIIVIKGADYGSNAWVFDVNGRMILQTIINKEPHKINFQSKGIYIIQVDNKRFKIFTLDKTV